MVEQGSQLPPVLCWPPRLVGRPDPCSSLLWEAFVFPNTHANLWGGQLTSLPNTHSSSLVC